jgi:site-specific recombinase XerD
MTLVAPTLRAFFTDRLTRQLQASPRTIASFRDTLRLLLCFTQETTGKQPATLDWDDLNETLISAFLEHLETDRHNTPRTRNLRLTASRSLFKYAAFAAFGARERDRAGSVDPAQAPPETADLGPHRSGVRGADRRARPVALGRPS